MSIWASNQRLASTVMPIRTANQGRISIIMPIRASNQILATRLVPVRTAQKLGFVVAGEVGGEGCGVVARLVGKKRLQATVVVGDN
jgi:hypothetical protein